LGESSPVVRLVLLRAGLCADDRGQKQAGAVAGSTQAQKAEFERLYKGPQNSGRTAFLDNDADIATLSLNAEQTQLIETQQFLVEEICRWFGVPPHKIMHLLRATFSNIEHQSIEVVVDSISPWVKRFEDEADYKLFGQNRQGLYTKMNMRALLRGDAASRIAYYDGMVKIGAYSPNRVLELEDENTLGDEGDIHVMQSQNVTLETIANPPKPPAPPSLEPAPAASSVAANGISADELAAMADLRALAEKPFAPIEMKKTRGPLRTRVTKHDEKGRILEFVQEEVD
jgi:hypothetical protein